MIPVPLIFGALGKLKLLFKIGSWISAGKKIKEKFSNRQNGNSNGGIYNLLIVIIIIGALGQLVILFFYKNTINEQKEQITQMIAEQSRLLTEKQLLEQEIETQKKYVAILQDEASEIKNQNKQYKEKTAKEEQRLRELEDRLKKMTSKDDGPIAPVLLKTLEGIDAQAVVQPNSNQNTK